MINNKKHFSMHTDPHSQDWDATVSQENHIAISIHDDLDLEDLSIKVMGPTRSTILKFKPDTRKIELDLFTGDPMFIELISSTGVSVKYIEGSGSSFYNN
jgi:hypothetical protein